MKPKVTNKLMDYRQQLMGIAAIGILLCHSCDVVLWPNKISYILGFGGTGVYIFVFLSAVGLYYSLSNKKEQTKLTFYKRRFERVFVPYLLIAVCWYGIKYFIFEHDVLAFFYETSTLSFWMDHKGAWYVAMLIPVYLIYPWFYDLIEKGEKKLRYIKIGFLIAVTLIVIVILSNYSKDVYEHLSQILRSVLMYLFAAAFADRIIEGKFSLVVSSLVCIMLFAFKSFIIINPVLGFIADIAWASLSIPIMCVCYFLLKIIPAEFDKAILGFFGRYSLELYLCNIFLIQAYKYFGIIDWINANYQYGGYISYAIILLTGILLSVLFNKAASSIASVMNSIKKCPPVSSRTQLEKNPRD